MKRQKKRNSRIVREVKVEHKANQVFVGLGSNLAEPIVQINNALIELKKNSQIRFVRCSSLYRSAPIGYVAQPDFINAVAEIQTELSPRQLLEILLLIEYRFGRAREFVNAPRVLDLDILLYENFLCDEPGLTIPHPRMHQRAFVLLPLYEIFPEGVIPGRGKIAELLLACHNQKLEKIEAQ